MKILGISDSHEAHACVMVDGQIISAVAEERLTRLKADTGFPSLAIKQALEIANVDIQDIDHVAFAGQKSSPYLALCKRAAMFSVQDWVKQNHQYWKPKLLEGKKLTPFDDFKLFKQKRGNKLYDDPYYAYVIEADTDSQVIDHELFKRIRSDALVGLTGIDRRKIKFYKHEDCHKYYGLLSSPRKLKEAIILTIEGGGDESSATHTVFKNHEMAEIWSSNEVNLGRLYRNVTLILGMKPSQHEYKVMGLAPYGSEYHGRRVLEFFNSLSQVDKAKILPTGVVKDLYFSVRQAIEGERFDGIAWALQEHIQIILEEWVRNCIKSSGIKNVVISGGVGQNIKACKHLIDNVEMDYFWSGPICGDGSLALGATYNAQAELVDLNSIKNLNSIYLGADYSAQRVNDAISSFAFTEEIKIQRGKTENLLAQMIAEGKICARFSGRMEFGQRALGNRSILANPCSISTVEKINQKVKFRDFWMPFTPSMTIGFAERSLDNEKAIYSPYMTMAFDLVKDLKSELPAVIHPADKTTRPQMLMEEDNPKYYQLLREVGKLTGYECVLNTSFNLHGEAIVETPEQAIQTFLNCELDALFFDEVVLIRKLFT